ncbi:response regulator [Sulfurimonas sp.]|uniref:response regulator n=1 Tax=Sulfurimonas sp. TaxID=2022749 RepID=UPI0035614B69
MLKCNHVNYIGKKYNILIIEDAQTINNYIFKTLSNMGHSCDQSFEFSKAQSYLEEKDYDYVLLDLNLPYLSGYDLYNEIRKLTDAKVMILSAETDTEQREALFKLGVVDYIVKDNHFNEAVEELGNIFCKLEQNNDATILVIDDSKFLQISIKKILNARNYRIVPAYTGEEGIQKLHENDVNMIILDMELPDARGLDILRKIKKEKHFSNIPVMILSGTNNPETIRDSYKAGAFDYISKPFNVEELVLKVDMSVDADRKNTEILCKQQLLNEYKDAVDRSSIVSKTDLKGIITFVNDKFVEISGYSKDELIGKPHNMVRHQDMPKEAFKDMWETIQNKKPWYGKVKNRKKDGGHYWVNTVINPIVDYDGKVVEYIGIRSDITEMEDIKEELEQNLNITSKNFSEAYKLSKEYERAIDSSNILSRTDISGKITYVNDKFIEISGYSEDELLGNTHRILKHPDNSAQIYKELWKTISSGKVWNGQLMNRTKDGKTYYVDSSIIPIFDEAENIIEYLAIRHDVTDIVTFHQELEDTQKEVIHKMGEVGESRSKETGYHVKRVAEYSKLLAMLAGLGKKNSELLYSASPMHDIGKVGIPDSILKKPGKLTDKEWIIMRSHCGAGYNILKKSKRPILKAAAIVAYRHHEKWDGTGYPKGLKGEDIHIFGRITAIADVFDALGSHRVYKKAWELDKILDLFREERGKHFDPKLVDIFLDNIDKFLVIRDKYQES